MLLFIRLLAWNYQLGYQCFTFSKRGPSLAEVVQLHRMKQAFMLTLRCAFSVFIVLFAIIDKMIFKYLIQCCPYIKHTNIRSHTNLETVTRIYLPEFLEIKRLILYQVQDTFMYLREYLNFKGRQTGIAVLLERCRQLILLSCYLEFDAFGYPILRQTSNCFQLSCTDSSCDAILCSSFRCRAWLNTGKSQMTCSNLNGGMCKFMARPIFTLYQSRILRISLSSLQLHLFQ